jgi:hypothetical protein
VINVADVIHGLRLRAHNARAAGEYALAQDLQMAVDTMIQMEEAQAARALKRASAVVK